MPARFIFSLDCEGKWGVADQLHRDAHRTLSTERLREAYAGLLALLDLQTALLLEARQSQFSAPAPLLELKAWVSSRILTWVVECFWADCLNLRYERQEEKLEIVLKCVRIFNIVLSDQQHLLRRGIS